MKHILLIASTLPLLSQCYSFRGITVDPQWKTYFVENVVDKSPNGAPAELADMLASQLSKTIRNETSLQLDESQPDIRIEMTITRYETVAGNIAQGETTPYNLFILNLQVHWTDTNNPQKSWKKNFNFQEEFPSTTDFFEIREELLRRAVDKLTEDIFNNAFTNW